ncbi:MAG: tetratricopeptide repeat protein [Chlorobiaceae bacterium]|nr:tetratricopeptide repeat protein [Chlorobiaceae bacterium]
MKRILYAISLTVACLLYSGLIAHAESANTFFDEGFALHQKGDLSGAIKLYSRAIESNPAFAMAYQMRGAAQQRLKKYPQAISDYAMVIAYGESYFKAVGYYNRGVVHNMTGAYSEAITDFTLALELDKKMAGAFFHRGIAKSKTGDLAGRFDDFRQAAKLGDLSAESFLNTYFPDWRLPPLLPVPLPAPAEPLKPVSP